MVRHNAKWGAYIAPEYIRPDVVPNQLRAHLDAGAWRAFASDVEKTCATFPPVCRYCIASFCIDLCAQKGYLEAAGPACQKVAEAHGAALAAKGVKITSFDKSGHYSYRNAMSAGWGYMHVARDRVKSKGSLDARRGGISLDG